MNIEDFRNYCLAKKKVTEELPFDENVLVFKVLGKMFALTHVQNFDSVSLKCDPAKALTLRELYPAVSPGYHLNKKHWNTIRMDSTIPDSFIRDLVDQSYDLVIKGLPKSASNSIEGR